MGREREKFEETIELIRNAQDRHSKQPQYKTPSVFGLLEKIGMYERKGNLLEGFMLGHVCLQLLFDSTTYSTTSIGVFMGSRQTLNQMAGDYKFDRTEWSTLTGAIRSCRLATRGIVGENEKLKEVKEAIKLMIKFIAEIA